MSSHALLTYRFTLFAALVLSLSTLSGCELLGDRLIPEVSSVDEVSWTDHVEPLLQRSCAACHGGDSPSAGLSVESWEMLVAGSAGGEVLIPFSGDESALIRLMSRTDRKSHPSKKNQLSEAEIALLKQWIDEGSKGPAGLTPIETAIDLVYVTHTAAPVVTVIESSARIVLARVNLTDEGFSSHARAVHVAVEPDGSFWYATIGSTLWSDPTVLAKFSRSNHLVATIPIESPGQILVHPDSDMLYVSSFPEETTEPRYLLEIKRSDLSRQQVQVTFPDAYPLALRPQGDVVFSSSLSVDQMMIVNLDDQKVRFFDIKGSKHAFIYFAMAPWGVKMWGSARGTSTLTLFSTSNPSQVIQHHSLWVGDDPRQITYSPDGTHVYAAIRGMDRVAVIDAVAEVPADPIDHPAMREPVGLAITRDGKTLFVASENEGGWYKGRFAFPEDAPPGTISVIDTETGEVVKVLESAPGAAAMGSSVVVPLTTN
ncbi:MAG: hypothetical protein O2797_00910 [Bacteroidetes bacterium]|nr:hypothetical protein [Bacteroidota bacterium]MDA1332759.1 hypothetical protein [Bacteroidota bacterium]